MKVFTTSLVALSALGGAFAQAQNYSAGLVAALNSANLTSLVSAVQSVPGLIDALQQGGNKTVLAPTNEAFAALGNNTPAGLLAATLQYHVLNGTFRVANAPTSGFNVTKSLLSNATYVQLPNNGTQAVVFGKASGNNTAFIAEASQNVSFVSAQDGPVYQNLLVQPISTVLTVPGNLSSVVTALGASSLAQSLTSANLLTTLANSKGLTIFAPVNAAFDAAQQTIAAASPEAVRNVLTTHVINGTVAYSTALTGNNPVRSAVAASGNNLTFAAANGGLTVTSGNVTARIIRTDILASNAVIHLIDTVLANTASNPAAASSAVAAASSSAAASPRTSTGSTGSTGSTTNAAAVQLPAAGAVVLASVFGAALALAA